MVNKWEIYYCSLNPTVGSEQKGTRPVLVISNNAVNYNLPVVTVIPISSLKEGEKVYPTEIILPIEISGLPKLSVAMLQQIRTVSKERLVNKASEIKDIVKREEMNESLKRYFELS